MTNCWDSCPSICGERSMTIEIATGAFHKLRYIPDAKKQAHFRSGFATFQRDC